MSAALLVETVSQLTDTARLSGDIYRNYLARHRACLLLLEGELGAGKTAFVRSLGPVLGIEENINSPTFNLLNIYENSGTGEDRCDLYHYDLYRLRGADELSELDFPERWSTLPRAGEASRLHAIEWWQCAADAIPKALPRYRLVIEVREQATAPADGPAIDESRVFTLYQL
jgi:tRNA threonylcarbamoyladenosine biosynthesis protein TsaE